MPDNPRGRGAAQNPLRASVRGSDPVGDWVLKSAGEMNVRPGRNDVSR
jgi:hypothetical protein